jgi:hypothetical protein
MMILNKNFLQSYTVYLAPDNDPRWTEDNYKSWPNQTNIPTKEDVGTILMDHEKYNIQPNTPYK